MAGLYSTNIIAEFEALFDIGFGTIRVIQNRYNNPDVFDQNIINGDNYFLRSSLYTSFDPNPLSIALNDEYMNEKEDLLVQIHDNDYDEVLSLSPKTAIYKLISDVFDRTDGVISSVVLCKNRSQEQFIKSQNPHIRTIIGDYTTMVSMYDVIVVHNYVDILKYNSYRRIIGKYILIPDYWFNMEKKDTTKPLAEVSALIADLNKINTVCPYDNFVLPVG